MSIVTRRINSGNFLSIPAYITTGYELLHWMDQAVEAGQLTRAAYEKVMDLVDHVDFDSITEGTRSIIDRAIQTAQTVTDSFTNSLTEAQVNADGTISNLRGNKRTRTGDIIENQPGEISSTNQPMTDTVPNDGRDGPLENARNNNNPTTRGTGETPITWFPKAEIGLRDTHTACLRYHNQYELSITQGNAGQHAAPAVYQFRMTSLYDIDATTASIQTPAWREYFATLYEFYSVIGCKWNIRVINSGATTDDTVNLWWGYYGKKRPNPADRTQLYHMKGIKGPLIVPPRIAGMGDRSCSGRYKRGDHKREVQEDSETQLWSAMGANPTLIENLVLYFTSDVREAADTDNDITFEIIIDYIVQFKDLKPEYQFRSFTTAGVGSDISTDSPANTA